MSSGHVNFYFLSTGYCGTRFHHHVLRLATNAEVWHQPGHEDIAEIVDLLESRFEVDPDSLLRAHIDDFPRLKRRIDKRLALPWIYGDTLNWMRALGYMLYRYVGAERLRLVELVRHPMAACRSMLAAHRGTPSPETSDIALAEEMASRWVRQYSLIRHQLQAIDDPSVCRTIRLEDNSLEQLSDLYGFLGLDGFDPAGVADLMENTATEVRHSHLGDAEIPASREELQAVWSVCAPLAAEYGYTEDVELCGRAPSRPIQTASAARAEDAPPPRPPSVKLFDYRGLGLIVRCPSGIHYVNQAGGGICFWRQAEGAFVPLVEGGPGSPGQRLLQHFNCRRDKEFVGRLRADDADFIEAVLAESGMDFISVNRSRIGETWDLSSWETWGSHDLSGAPWEAWVPVRIQPSPYIKVSGVLSGVSGEGILVWENSN